MTILLAIFQQCTGVHQEELLFAFGFVWKTNAVSTHWFHEKNMVPSIWGQHGWPTYVNPENQKHFAHQGRNYTENITITKTNDQSMQLCRNKVENTWAYCTWTPTEPTTNHIYPAKLSCFILFRPNAASKPMPLQRSHILCTFHWRDHSRTSQSNGLGWGANIVCTSTRTWECHWPSPNDGSFTFAAMLFCTHRLGFSWDAPYTAQYFMGIPTPPGAADCGEALERSAASCSWAWAAWAPGAMNLIRRGVACDI